MFIPVFFFYVPLSAQYYFTGEVKDEHGDKLQNVSIVVQSTGALYRTGSEGNFEIMSRITDDSLLFAIAGYEPYTAAIRSTDFLRITLKIHDLRATVKKSRLLSATSGRQVTFPADINGVSYNVIRQFLDMGQTVPVEAVRIEELLNYHNFYYEQPDADSLFHFSSEMLPCPWNETHELLYLNMCTRITNRQEAPPANLVYVIDASGSMDMLNKLSLIKSGFRLLIKNLRDIDTVSIVVFGSRVGTILKGIPGSRKGQIMMAIEALQPDGPSPGIIGVKLAYQAARQQYIEGGINKVILITDGDICNGMEERQQMASIISEQSQVGITLTCLGVGVDSTQKSELPWLAQTGQGNFASIADAKDAEKVLLNELGRNICTVADSVCITIGFDTTLVKEYHLIGFDSKAVGDTALRLEGGKINSGHSLLALFELVPNRDSSDIESIADVKVCYALPGKNTALHMNYQCCNRRVPFDKATGDQRKAACIALFGMKLKDRGWASGISWADVEKITRKNFAANNALDKDYITLVVKARKVYEHIK